jgi:hypothetical protein
MPMDAHFLDWERYCESNIRGARDLGGKSNEHPAAGFKKELLGWRETYL